MGEGTRLKVEGLAEAHATLAAISADMSELSGPLGKSVRALALRMRLNVNSRTYALAASLAPINTPLAAEVVTTSLYGGVQEWGWPRRNVPAQAFTQRAIADGWPAIYAALAEHCSAIIDKHGAAAAMP